jgi:hypothetical protein
VVAGAYLVGVWLEGVGARLPERALPRTLTYFLQVAALFPVAATASIDYRVEGFVCVEKIWRELDTRPYFPLDANDKENRFFRVMHFFKESRPTMTALDSYLVESHNAGTHEDGIPRGQKLGGVRFFSLRIPLPELGHPLRSERRPLDEYPYEQRSHRYYTPVSVRAERCDGARDPREE